jgi:hypothetical protein
VLGVSLYGIRLFGKWNCGVNNLCQLLKKHNFFIGSSHFFDIVMITTSQGELLMSMTHYMELLAVNQPWNLIIYMVIPVAFAEALVATEFFVVYSRAKSGLLRSVNKWLGIALGFYFLGIFLNLSISVVPTIEWRGTADVLAVGSYLSGVIPLFSIALLELGLIGRGKTDAEKMKLHFILLTAFLVVSHVAMVFGMVDPAIMGWNPGTEAPVPHSHSGH